MAVNPLVNGAPLSVGDDGDGDDAVTVPRLGRILALQRGYSCRGPDFTLRLSEHLCPRLGPETRCGRWRRGPYEPLSRLSDPD